MTKKIAIAALACGLMFLPVSCAGPAVREASAQVEHLRGQMENTLEELAAAQAELDALLSAPDADEANIEAVKAQQAQLMSQVKALGSSMKGALEELPDAWKADMDSAVASVSGTGGYVIDGLLTTGGMQGGAIGMVSTLLLSLWRDRRKRKGLDPLQREDVYTPPTSGTTPQA